MRQRKVIMNKYAEIMRDELWWQQYTNITFGLGLKTFWCVIFVSQAVCNK